MKRKKFEFTPAYLATAILLQTLYFKFSAHPESVAVFTTLGVEPWGRILSGVVELIAAIALIIPASRLYGAMAGAGVMVGAILSHLFVIGIESGDDGGTLFILALVVLASCLAILVVRKKEAMQLFYKFVPSGK